MVLCLLLLVSVIQERLECGESLFVDSLLCIKFEFLFVKFFLNSCWFVSVSLESVSFIGGDKLKKKGVADGHNVVESKVIPNRVITRNPSVQWLEERSQMCLFILIQRTIVDGGLWNVIYVERVVRDGYSCRYGPMVSS